MTRAVRQIGASALILIMFCIACRLFLFKGYTAYIQIPSGIYQDTNWNDYQLVIEKPDVLNPASVDIGEGYLRIAVHPEETGESDVTIYNDRGETLSSTRMHVSRFHTVYDLSTGGFTGDTAALIALGIFWLLVSAIMLWNYRQVKGAAFYAYITIYFAGFSLFALTNGLLMVDITIRHILKPLDYSMLAAYQVINGASIHFMMLTMPLILVFAVSMGVSNIILLLHEKPRPQNFLGLLVGILLIIGEGIGYYVFSNDYTGSEWQVRLRDTLINSAATVFVYFECMLAGSVICGIKAARYQPEFDKDYIIILGCWFRKDGSLPPLLRGRVDRAIDFWSRQRKATGKTAVIIPSGGQGKNETMAEAEAMRRYLLTQNIPDEIIRMEDKSRNTYQNMENSKRIIESESTAAKTIFATTNYHVFRSGVWANQAGLKAEGIGGKTKWWFWPNAFMRECAGLMQHRWKQELAFLIILLGFFGLLSVILS